MDTYIKAVLYIYPRLEKIEKDYGEHIGNKAILSYDYRAATEALTEYIAGEIIRKNLIEDLKRRVDRALERLSAEEKFLLELRYFGRKKQLAEYRKQDRYRNMCSERNYYRKQSRVLGKISSLLKLGGLTEEYFLREYSCFDWLTSVCRSIDEGKEGAAVAREKEFFRILTGENTPQQVGEWLGRNGKRKRSGTVRSGEKREKAELRAK